MIHTGDAVIHGDTDSYTLVHIILKNDIATGKIHSKKT